MSLRRKYTVAPPTPRPSRYKPYPLASPNSGMQSILLTTMTPGDKSRLSHTPKRLEVLGLSDQEKEQEEQEEQEEEGPDHRGVEKPVVKLEREDGEGPSQEQGEEKTNILLAATASIEEPKYTINPLPASPPHASLSFYHPDRIDSLGDNPSSPPGLSTSPSTSLKRVTSTELPPPHISFPKRRKPKTRKKLVIVPQTEAGVAAPSETALEATSLDSGKEAGSGCTELSFKPDGQVRDVYVVGSKMVVKVRINHVEYMDGTPATSQLFSEHVDLSLQYFLKPFLHYLTFRHTDVSNLEDEFYLSDDPVIYRFHRIPHGEGNEYKRDRKTTCHMWEQTVVITPIAISSSDST